MTTSLSRQLKLHSVSPIGLAVLSYCGFLFAWTFPPGIYTFIVIEPDYMFLNVKMLVFVTLCTAAFIAGAHITGKRAQDEIVLAPQPLLATRPLLVLCVPILVFTVCCGFYLRALNESANVFSLLASSQGATVKQEVGVNGLSEGILDYSFNLLMATLWWASIRSTQINLKGIGRIIFNVVFWTGCAVAVLTTLGRVDRNMLTAFLLGLGVCLIYRRVRIKGGGLMQIVGIAAATVVFVCGFFLLVTALRGFGSSHLLLFGLTGYTISAYNRLAAQLIGVMHYSYEGTGLYLVRYIPSMVNNRLLSFIPHALGFPSPLAIWESDFTAALNAGLFPGFNWSTAFGFVFADLGWWTPFFFFGCGLLTGWTWVRFVSRRLFGLIAYPWLGYSVLFWFGCNVIFDYELVGLLEACVALAVYERLFLRPVPAAGQGFGERSSRWNHLPQASSIV